MTSILRKLSLFATLLAVVTFVASTAHAQDQPPYPPPPYPPQPYPAPYPPPPNPPPYTHRQVLRDKVDFSAGITGQYTQPMTSDGPASVWTTDSTGLLLSLRALPVAGSGVELNYQYTKFSEVYNSPVGGGVFVQTTIPTSYREVTGAFLFHSHNMWGAQPFLALGGGGIDFVPRVSGAHNQWRGAGLAELGFDLPITRFCGFRMEGRSLFYRAPNFNNSALQSRTWVATVNPAGSFYVRW
jgi:hypothetical protein